MKYRRFGRTELKISEIAFGGGRSGGILIDADDETRRKAVRTAAEGDFDFDTSRPDGAPRKLLDVSLINGLGWQAKTSLKDGLQRAYCWFVDQLT